MRDIKDKTVFSMFSEWFTDAKDAEPDNPNAMTLATCNAQGQPSARTVLLKSWDERGFVFYTNITSHKARDIRDNNNAALLFYWKSLNRQIRIEGSLEQVADETADAYFQSRPRESQLGAWASQQSAEMLGGRTQLEEALADAEQRFRGRSVPRPAHWSGYRLTPRRIEFWEEGPSRLHHRRLYEHEGNNRWTEKLLFP